MENQTSCDFANVLHPPECPVTLENYSLTTYISLFKILTPSTLNDLFDEKFHLLLNECRELNELQLRLYSIGIQIIAQADEGHEWRMMRMPMNRSCYMWITNYDFEAMFIRLCKFLYF